MSSFFIGFFLAMAFTGIVLVICTLKDAFRSGFAIGD